MDDPKYVHHEDPFRGPEGSLEPARRFRGRLAAPVTIWTSGAPEEPSGLTVGSILLAEGEPSHLLGLINDLTDLYDKVVDTGRLVVHIAAREQRVLADRFAGLRPSPGGLFADLDVETSDWGPVLVDLPNRAFCKLVDTQAAGYQRLVKAEIESLELEPLSDPLVHFRGTYRGLID